MLGRCVPGRLNEVDPLGDALQHLQLAQGSKLTHYLNATVGASISVERFSFGMQP